MAQSQLEKQLQRPLYGMPYHYSYSIYINPLTRNHNHPPFLKTLRLRRPLPPSRTPTHPMDLQTQHHATSAASHFLRC
jgi:hypothetical protein